VTSQRLSALKAAPLTIAMWLRVETFRPLVASQTRASWSRLVVTM